MNAEELKEKLRQLLRHNAPMSLPAYTAGAALELIAAQEDHIRRLEENKAAQAAEHVSKTKWPAKCLAQEWLEEMGLHTVNRWGCFEGLTGILVRFEEWLDGKGLLKSQD